MKKLEELGISPAPWKYISDSGYDRETGDFNTRDTVCDSAETVIVDWWNGETYGEVYPNAEADACLISAAPKLYDAAERLLRFHDESCIHGNRTFEEITKDYKKAITDLKTALAEAAGEREVK